jgi:hypothetical protein
VSTGKIWFRVSDLVMLRLTLEVIPDGSSVPSDPASHGASAAVRVRVTVPVPPCVRHRVSRFIRVAPWRGDRGAVARRPWRGGTRGPSCPGWQGATVPCHSAPAGLISSGSGPAQAAPVGSDRSRAVRSGWRGRRRNSALFALGRMSSRRRPTQFHGGRGAAECATLSGHLKQI